MIRERNNLRRVVLSSLVGAVIMALVSFPSNYFIMYPVYENFMPMDTIIAAYQLILPSADELWKCLLIFNVPFTFVKGALDAVLCFLVYKPLSPILHGRK